VTQTDQTLSPINDAQQQVLRKIAESSSLDAAEAFSQLLAREITATVPNAQILSLSDAVEQLGSPADAVTAAWVPVVGQIEASVLLLFDDASVSRLCELLDVQQFTELGQSAIGEVANIIGTRYVRGIAQACKMTFEPEPPEVASGMLGAVVGTVLAMSSIVTNYALLVDTVLEVPDNTCSVRFLFIPSDSSVKALIDNLGAA